MLDGFQFLAILTICLAHWLTARAGYFTAGYSLRLEIKNSLKIMRKIVEATRRIRTGGLLNTKNKNPPCNPQLRRVPRRLTKYSQPRAGKRPSALKVFSSSAVK